MKIDQNKKHAPQGKVEIKNVKLIHSKYNTNLTINIKSNTPKAPLPLLAKLTQYLSSKQ